MKLSMTKNKKNLGDSPRVKDVSFLFDRNIKVVETLGALMERKARYLAKHSNHSFVKKEYEELRWAILEVDQIVRTLIDFYNTLSDHYLVTSYEYQALDYAMPANRPLYSFSREVTAFRSLMSTGKLPESSVPLALHEKVHRFETRLKSKARP